MIVVITVAIDRSPTEAQVDEARKTAIAVRDSNEDDKYLQPAAYMVVDVAHQAAPISTSSSSASNGAQGIEPDAVKLENAGTEQEKVVKTPSRPQVLQAIPHATTTSARPARARRHEPQEQVPQRKVYAFDARLLLHLRQFEEARSASRPSTRGVRGRRWYGYKAWDRLHDGERSRATSTESRKLAEAVAA
jgi:hypothetical protein